MQYDNKLPPVWVVTPWGGSHIYLLYPLVSIYMQYDYRLPPVWVVTPSGDSHIYLLHPLVSIYTYAI